MADKQLFKIGEVARMYHLSLGILRHYEKEGLLAPEYTDPETGYRYYSTRQFEVLNTIRYLRMLDLPLADIKEYMQNRKIPVIRRKTATPESADPAEKTGTRADRAEN